VQRLAGSSVTQPLLTRRGQQIVILLGRNSPHHGLVHGRGELTAIPPRSRKPFGLCRKWECGIITLVGSCILCVWGGEGASPSILHLLVNKPPIVQMRTIQETDLPGDAHLESPAAQLDHNGIIIEGRKH